MQKRKTPLPLLLIASYTHTHTYCPKNIIRAIVTAASAVIRTNGGVEWRNAPPCNSNASQSRGLDIIITIISDCPYTI